MEREFRSALRGLIRLLRLHCSPTAIADAMNEVYAFASEITAEDVLLWTAALHRKGVRLPQMDVLDQRSVARIVAQRN